MGRNYFDEYMQIVGQMELGTYKSPEEEASKIEKCTILKSVDVSYSNEVIGYNARTENCILV